jgi:hypothetical protein
MRWHSKQIVMVLFFTTSVGMECVRSFAADDSARLRFDQHCITIDGNDMVVFSSAFHYFRCPRELWADRFRKLKQAGFNAVETYAAWNYHEQTPPSGPDDFSELDMTDLHDWLAMATDQFGLQVILRPGPYICAEWDGGGYPQWLLTKRPADFHGKEWLRGDDPTYLAWCRHWYTAVARVAAPFQITHRPVGKSGIILWQIENEYDYSDLPVNVKHAQIDFLAHVTRDAGIDIPLTTCMTDNPEFRRDDFLRENIIETRNTYPKFSMGAMLRDIGMLDRYQPEKFKMITELQGGWFSQVGGRLSEEQGFDETHINHVTLFAWEHGFTVTNYYMGFGGTNFGDWAAETITTSYDYDAPLRECGGITKRYLAVQGLGNFIAEHGRKLARSVFEPIRITDGDNAAVHVASRRAADGSRYIFIRTERRIGLIQGTMKLKTPDPDGLAIEVNYALGPFGSKVLYLPPGANADDKGTWFPKVPDEPNRPAVLPAAVTIDAVRMMPDPGPSQWSPIQPGQSEEAAGIFNRGFVYYRSHVPVPADLAAKRISLSARTRGHDWVGFEMNGRRLTSESPMGGIGLDSDSTGAMLVGLYENGGRPNFGSDLERPGGLADLNFHEASNASRALTNWRTKLVEGDSERAADVTVETDDSNWSTVDVGISEGLLTTGQSAVYRAWIDIPAGDLKIDKSIVLGRIDDDGIVYINGQRVGESHDFSTVQRFSISQCLRPGKNLVAVFVHNQDGPGGLSRGVVIEDDVPGLKANWEISDQPAGVAEKWWRADLDDSSWRQARLADSGSRSDSLLTWYRLAFSLPALDPHQWVPWKIRLDVIGNGFLYLNGHPLGRWWEQGPQRDFYLPECWLNFGPGKTNNFTLSLRPTSGIQVRAAEVSPYANMAEVQ